MNPETFAAVPSERALIGAILKDPAAVLPLCDAAGLSAESFTDPDARAAFAATAALQAEGNPVDIAAVAGEMAGDAASLETLARFMDDCPTVTHAAYHAGKIREAEHKAGLAAALRDSLQGLQAGGSAADAVATVQAAGEAAEGGALLPATDAAEYLETEPPQLDPVIENVFEMGDKVELIGGSKRRKSFAAIELAVHVATGRDWMGLKIPKRRRVQYVNLELKSAWIHRRIRRACRAHGIDPTELRGWLCMVNARGRGAIVRKQLVELARRDRAGLVIIDPRYKLHLPGEVENAGEGVQGIFDLVDAVVESGPSVLVVHHDPKGDSGDKAIQDRGGGSGWGGRDVDARFTLTPQKHDPEGVSEVEVMCRNFAPIPSFCIRWEDGRFHLAPDSLPVAFTSWDRRKAIQGGAVRSPESFEPVARDAAREALGRETLLAKIMAAGASRDVARACLDGLCERGEIACTPRAGQKNGAVKYGLPAVIQSYMNPRLPV